jgi:hypothetical protein
MIQASRRDRTGMRETGWRLEEDQNEVLWSLLVDLYTEETRFEVEP